jgi:hypothetical protein
MVTRRGGKKKAKAAILRFLAINASRQAPVQPDQPTVFIVRFVRDGS